MEKNNPVEIWIRTLCRKNSNSESTMTYYPENLKLFCEFVETTPREILAEYDQVETFRQAERFKRKYTDLMNQWINSLEDTGRYFKGSLNVFLVPVRSFFRFFELPLGKAQFAK
jgi:site-specific recombinase XerD